MDHRLLQGRERWCVCDLTGAKGCGIFQVINYVRVKNYCVIFSNLSESKIFVFTSYLSCSLS